MQDNMPIVGSLYLAFHLAMYAMVLRRLPRFRTERTIFFYHALSFAFVSIIAVSFFAIRRETSVAAWGIAIVALHGLYSLSFLELWSLAQGSYSIGILRRLLQEGRLTDSSINGFESVGDEKLRQRLESLTKLGIIRTIPENSWECTPVGRPVGLVLLLASRTVGLERLEAKRSCERSRKLGPLPALLILTVGFVLLFSLQISTGVEVSILAGSTLAYLFMCELYVFIATFLASSISVATILQLVQGRRQFQEVLRSIRGDGMAVGRFAALQRVGLVVETDAAYRLTGAGRLLARMFSNLNAFFFPNYPLPSA